VHLLPAERSGHRVIDGERVCETFPGLGPTWIRVAVRDAGASDRFAAALADALGQQFNT